MNLASWIILAIVIGVLALAVKATFFKKKGSGGCCDVGDKRDDDLDLSGLICPFSCDSCAACHKSMSRECVKPPDKPS